MKKRTLHRARSALEPVTDGLQDLIDSAEELLSALQDEKGEAVELLRTRVSATKDSATKRLDALRSIAGAIGRRAATSTVKFARTDPWRAVAIGALATLGCFFLMRGTDEE